MMAAMVDTHGLVPSDGPEDQDIEEQSPSDGEEDGEDVPGGSDVDDAEDEDEGAKEEDAEGDGSGGWAEAMAKILGKKVPDNKTTILAKNKELDKIKQKEREEQLEKKKQIDKKRAWEMMCREKADVVKDREKEKVLQRTATRGVVQLFNAVRKHQKTVDDKVKEVGGSDRKKAKILSAVSKKDFIDVLRRSEGSGAGTVKTEKEKAGAEAEGKPAWSVLREDFMMGASMKDWDQESDPEETAGGQMADSDSD